MSSAPGYEESILHLELSFRSVLIRLSGPAFIALCLITAPVARAQAGTSGVARSQDAEASSSTPEPPAIVTLDLPDAPSITAAAADRPIGSSEVSDKYGSSTAQHARSPRFAAASRAPLYDKYIEPGQTAQPLIGFQRKMLFGAHQVLSPYFLVSVVSAAGYEQATNGSPNYGSNPEAFGQRVGAAAATNSSQSIFTDGLMPAIFHQDPRYYIKGKDHSLVARGGYAISRVFVTHSDGGSNAPNFSLFAGHAATALLQNAYYPAVNQRVSETAKDYASSFAGTALSNGIREFLPDLLHLVRLE